MIRKLLERLSRRRVLKRRLPLEFRRTAFYVTPDAELKYLIPGKGAFDLELLGIVRDFIKKDSCVWDVGANVGFFTFSAASIAVEGRVISIEADIWLAQLLRKSLSLKSNRQLRVDILPTAISNVEGTATFLIAKRGRASNALESAGGRSQMGNFRDKVMVPTLTLDKLLETLPHPTFMKIDVEGAELQVLRGSQQVLKEIRPVLYVEVGEEDSAEIADLLSKNSYDIFDGKTRNSIKQCSFNTLAIPKESPQLSILRNEGIIR